MNEVIVERPTSQVAVVRLNRPEARNALNQEVREQLAAHFTALGQDAEVRAISRERETCSTRHVKT